MSDRRTVLRRYALQNAVMHKSIPQAGTVLGMVMGNHPEFRTEAKEIKAELPSIIEEITLLSEEEREEALFLIAPQMCEELHQKKQKKRDHTLPDLSGAENGVVMRFAPNPSGPLHLGHARAAYLNDSYIERYGGRYFLRIEDTDPKRVDPEAYDMVREDVAWMGLKITDTVFQSDRFEEYYTVGRELLAKGAAYVCTCNNETFRELKMEKIPCPCRSQTPEEGLEGFEQMLAGAYEEGSVTIRLKTNISAPDPAMRDYPLLRVLTSVAHERVDAVVYPLMNLSVAVDDHLLGMTHVIRGKDHIANTTRQRYIFDYMGWDIPEYRHYGRMGIDGIVLSTSGMREGIKSGAFTGWDDVHLGTLRALARRGISPAAVKSAMVDIGIGETDIQFSWENLYAKNKEIIDPDADRFFFVADPVEITVSGAEPQVASAMKYPGNPSRGIRTIPFSGNIVLPGAEVPAEEKMVRLKDLFNITLSFDKESIKAEYAGTDLQEAREAKAPIIQWLPANYGIPCRLLRPDTDMKGLCEPEIRNMEGSIVQFERVGFARIDQSNADGITAYFCHR